MITQEELWQVLDYSPDTGEFRWKFNLSRKTVIGSVAGTTNGGGYIQIRLHGKIYAAHRLAVLWVTGRTPNDVVDHKNHNKADNRWCNLRLATKQENQCNRKGLAGVRKRGNSYQARIYCFGREVSLGSFESEAAAREARRSAELRLFKEFAPFGQVGN